MANRFNIVKVSHDDDGIRLDRWFKRHHKHVPFGMIAKLLRKGLIKVNSKKCDVNLKILRGDVIQFPNFQIDSEVKLEKKNDRIEKLLVDSVIFKDENIIVLNKPIGLAVQGGSKIAYSVDDLSHCLKFGYEDKPKLVHRLDKDTSGILILARKANVAAELAGIFKAKRLSKKYLAILQGVPKPLQGKIDIPIEKQEKDNFEKVHQTKNKAKRAITFYNVIDYTGNKLSLVEFDLVTGKTHQLRVHSALIECPILGDEKYGTQDFRFNFAKRLYLHAYKTEFSLGNKNYKFKAPPPAEFKETLNTLGLNVSN